MLTYAEIETVTAELDFDETDVKELHGFLERAEIELVERPRPGAAWTTGARRERFAPGAGAK